MTDNLMTLDDIRKRLDLGDTQLLEWLSIRANLVKEVARIKANKNASLHAAEREAAIFNEKQKLCRVHGLDFDYVAEIVSLIIWHSKQLECDELDRETFLNTEKLDAETLRKDLLKLTKAEAPKYDEFCSGKSAESIRNYLDRERERIRQACQTLTERILAVDLGCATGQTTEFLAQHFPSVKAFDISPDMIEYARQRRSWDDHVAFLECDLDAGNMADLDDDSVSFAVANFGAASELRDDLLHELKRFLQPGGKALLSYYNKDALINHWIYPWPATVHSHLNPYNDTLEVWSESSVYTIHARAATIQSIINDCAEIGLDVEICETYPTLQPIFPSFIVHNQRVRKAFDIGIELDRHLADRAIGRGAYIIAIVTKPA